jgi:hypothetical protein
MAVLNQRDPLQRIGQDDGVLEIPPLPSSTILVTR